MLEKYRLELIVFISGTVGMILELLGTRLMAPYFGSSLYTWTALITVVLASMSIGYYIGGKYADKNASFTMLANFFVYAATFICLVVIFNQSIMRLVDSWLPLKLAVTLAALILFAPVCMFMGMISPYAVKLKLTKLKESGSEVGRLYAISTMGSIVGTVAAGFFLITFMGTNNLLILLALILLANAILSDTRFKLPYLLTIVLIMIAWGYAQNHIQQNLRKGIVEIDTPYSHAYVMDLVNEGERPIRAYFTGLDETQSAIYLDNPDEAVFHYINFFNEVGKLVPKFDHALLIGGGTYTLPKLVTKKFPDVKMDVVEIDPKLIGIAQKYFDYEQNNRVSIFHEDGRRFTVRTKNNYDVIFLDAFSNYVSIPAHLTTMEFFQQLQKHLKPDGVVAINLIGSLTGDKGLFTRAFVNSVKRVFPYTNLYAVDKNADTNVAQNWVLVASMEKIRDANDDETKAFFEDNLWTNKFETGSQILTDDFAPVDQYTNYLL